MRKNITLGLLLASAVALAPFAIASAQDGGPHGGWHGGHGGHGAAFAAFGKLNLSDAQKASIKQIVKASFEQNKGQFQALRQQREAFAQLTPTSAGYQSAANSLAQAEAAATQARVLQRANIRAQIYAVLTPAQQSQLAQLKAERQARRQQWEQFKAQHPAPAAAQ